MHTTPSRILLFVGGAFALTMLLLNLLTDRSSLWAIWPIWGLAIPGAAIVGALQMPGHRLLGIWLGGGGMIVLGLLGIDIRDGGNWWFFWPAGVWLLISLVVIGLTVDILGLVPTSRPATEDDTPRLP
jgi:hypothetical protein